MKVKEILEELKNADPEADVHFKMGDGCCSEFESLEAGSVELIKMPWSDRKDYVEFYFHPPWFLASCRKSSAAKAGAQKVIDEHRKWQEEQDAKSIKKDE